MTKLMAIDLDRNTEAQIEDLVRATVKPEKVVIREIVITRLKSYKSRASQGLKALLDLAQWAEIHDVTGPKDLSENLDTYLWDE